MVSGMDFVLQANVEEESCMETNALETLNCKV
jgi:hypothetical protein